MRARDFRTMTYLFLLLTFALLVSCGALYATAAQVAQFYVAMLVALGLYALAALVTTPIWQSEAFDYEHGCGDFQPVFPTLTGTITVGALAGALFVLCALASLTRRCATRRAFERKIDNIEENLLAQLRHGSIRLLKVACHIWDRADLPYMGASRAPRPVRLAPCAPRSHAEASASIP